MLRRLTVLVAVTLVFLGGTTLAQNSGKPMTNADVVSMVKVGLPDGTVISAIQSQPTAFDISATALLDLKKQGVSDKVMNAMVAAAGKPQTAAPGAQAPVTTPAAQSTASVASPAGGSGAQIPSGTTISVRTINAINSQTAKEGQTFKASLDQPIESGGATLVPAGADVTLKLVKVKESGHFTGSTDLTVAIDSLTLNGNRVEVQTGSVTTSSSGRGKRSAVMVGGGTAAGALLGGLLGGRKGALLGAGVGGGAGAAAQVMTKGQKVVIPAETKLTFTLTAAASL
jgi:hypothetical protein